MCFHLPPIPLRDILYLADQKLYIQSSVLMKGISDVNLYDLDLHKIRIRSMLSYLVQGAGQSGRVYQTCHNI